jgi:hypothetical protein
MYASAGEFDVPTSNDQFMALTKHCRGHGANISTEDHREGDKRLDVYREWARSHLMGPQDDMLSDAIMIIPSGSPLPKYRDDANGPFWILTILKEMTISPSLQVPQLVLPSECTVLWSTIQR